MKYQLAYYDPGPESWRYYRKDFRIVGFDSLEDAEREAIALSQGGGYSGHEVIVMTIHACFKTETEYPKVAPIQRTRRVAMSMYESEPATPEKETLT